MIPTLWPRCPPVAALKPLENQLSFQLLLLLLHLAAPTVPFVVQFQLPHPLGTLGRVLVALGASCCSRLKGGCPARRVQQRSVVAS